MTTFEELLNRAARRGLPKTAQPRSRAEMARLAGIRRQHLYLLLNGEREAQPWTIARVAKGWGLSENTVSRALRETYRRAQLLA